MALAQGYAMALARGYAMPLARGYAMALARGYAMARNRLALVLLFRNIIITNYCFQSVDKNHINFRL